MRTTLFITLASAFFLTSCLAGRSDRSVENAEKKAAEFSVRQKTVLVMGDSLTAGYQLPLESAYPAQLETLLQSAGYPYRVSNAGVSGDTSAGLLSRTDWLLEGPLPDLAIVCIGANDGLQGLPVDQMDANIRAILAKLKAKNIPTVFVGIKIPRNLGAEYVAAFEGTFPKIAKDAKPPFYPFLLEGMAKNPKFTLADGLHPNPEGAAIIAKNVFEFLKKENLVAK